MAKKKKKTKEEITGRVWKTEMPKGWEGDLSRLIDEIFEVAYARDWSWADLARFAGVNYVTVWSLGEKITRFPHLLTIWKLSKALQINITFEAKRPSTVKDKRRTVKA